MKCDKVGYGRGTEEVALRGDGGTVLRGDGGTVFAAPGGGTGV
jgi:hypothetical protein